MYPESRGQMIEEIFAPIKNAILEHETPEGWKNDYGNGTR